MSNINPNNIDGTYPIAGQDNDSQGFRDNFTNIKNNFTFAKSELEDLATKVVLKSPLSGGTLNNDFGDALVVGAKISDFSEVRYDLGTTSGSVVLNHNNGHYQTVTASGTITLGLSTGANWPGAGALGRIRLEVEITNAAHQLILDSGVNYIGDDSIMGLEDGTITFRDTGKFIFEFTTEDGGTTIAINDLTRGRIVHSDTIGLSSNATTSGSSLTNVGLGFTAGANKVYKFEAFIPFAHSSSSSNTHTFSVQFSAGTCNYLVEQQAGPTSGFSIDASTVSNATVSTITTNSTSVKFAKVSGTFTHTSDTPVEIRFATSGGTLTVQKGASLTWTRVA